MSTKPTYHCDAEPDSTLVLQFWVLRMAVTLDHVMLAKMSVEFLLRHRGCVAPMVLSWMKVLFLVIAIWNMSVVLHKMLHSILKLRVTGGRRGEMLMNLHHVSLPQGTKAAAWLGPMMLATDGKLRLPMECALNAAEHFRCQLAEIDKWSYRYPYLLLCISWLSSTASNCSTLRATYATH